MTQYDVTSSFVQIVDADRSEAEEVLARISPMRSLADRLSALGLDDRAVWTESPDAREYTLVWRFGEDSNARLDWRLSLETDGSDRTTLTVRLGGRGGGKDGRARMLKSWSFVEELALAHARRLARTIGEYANADEYEAAPLRLYRVA
jgi:hypothetical protein